MEGNRRNSQRSTGAVAGCESVGLHSTWRGWLLALRTKETNTSTCCLLVTSGSESSDGKLRWKLKGYTKMLRLLVKNRRSQSWFRSTCPARRESERRGVLESSACCSDVMPGWGYQQAESKGAPGRSGVVVLGKKREGKIPDGLVWSLSGDHKPG